MFAHSPRPFHPLVYCFPSFLLSTVARQFPWKMPRIYGARYRERLWLYTTIWQERTLRKLQALPINPSTDSFRFYRVARFIGVKLNRPTFRNGAAQWVISRFVSSKSDFPKWCASCYKRRYTCIIIATLRVPFSYCFCNLIDGCLYLSSCRTVFQM